MFVDYSDLNMEFPKDVYPLPNIDKMVYNLSDFKLVSFMKSYIRYNQTSMDPKDYTKITFMTNRDNFATR